MKDSKRSTDAPELRLQILARLAEHRKSVRVQCLRNANVCKHLHQCRVVFHKGLALAHAASHNIPRRVVLADDNGLAAIRRELHRQAGEIAVLKQLNQSTAACRG